MKKKYGNYVIKIKPNHDYKNSWNMEIFYKKGLMPWNKKTVLKKNISTSEENNLENILSYELKKYLNKE